MDLDDLLEEPAAASARAGGRFKPKAKPRPKKQASVSTASVPSVDAKEKLSTQSSSFKGEEPVALDREVAHNGSANLSDALPSEVFAPVSGTMNQSSSGKLPEECVDVFSGGIHSSMEATTLKACSGVDIEAPAFPDGSGIQDSAIFRDFAASEMDEGIHIHNERTQTEESEDYFDMETLDIVQEGTIAYGQGARKFQPKPKLQDNVQTEESNQGANEASNSCYAADDIEYFSMGSTASEFLLNREPRNETSNMDTNFYGIVEEELSIPEMPGELASEMDGGNSSGGWEHEEPVECPSNNSTVGEDNCWGNTVNGHHEGASNEGKSKKAGLEENRPSQKRKNTNDAPNQSCEKPQKKFRLSTRRQRRKTLEKELLETPDDEIRFLRIKDMLRLVDYKEWLEKKEAKEAGVPQTQERTRKASDNRNSQNNEETNDSESTENQETYTVRSANFHVNHHTYAKWKPKGQWSKQDTELFYEGIRQFGSDFSVIKQLFPDKSREQIKQKFKLEERQHPLKLNDALTNRIKHYYHFQNVIKKLQKAGAEAAQKANEEEEEEEAAARTTAGAEENAEAQTTDVPSEEVVAKSEAADGAGAVAGGNRSYGGEHESDARSDGGDEEADFWGSYESEI